MGVSEAVGVSCGCLGLPLMFYITSLLWFVGVVPMIILAINLAIHVLCAGGMIGCLRL